MKSPLTILVALFAACVIGGSGVYIATHATPTPEPKAGAVSGPIDQNNYHCYAGVCDSYGSEGPRTATTTVCAIQGPSATSTVSAAVRIDTGSTTATTWFIGTGPTPYATTTALGTGYSVAGSAQGFIQASTTPGAAAAPTVMAPNAWLIVYAGGGITAGDTGAGFVPSGRCFASFKYSQS